MADLLHAGLTLSAQDIGRLPTARPLEAPAAWLPAICPNFGDWVPGDIILVHRVSSSFDPFGFVLEGSQRISLVARGSNAEQFSHVTHAGIYVGDGLMVDSVPRMGVRRISVWTLASVRTLQVRRAVGFDGPAIAAFAEGEVGKSYNILALIRDGFIDANPYEDLSGMYCTQLVLRAATATDQFSRNLAEKPEHNPFFPAMLVQHPALAPVSVHWRQAWK